MYYKSPDNVSTRNDPHAMQNEGKTVDNKPGSGREDTRHAGKQPPNAPVQRGDEKSAQVHYREEGIAE